MKKTFLQTLMLFTVMLFTSITASAYDFYADGIYYNITSTENKTVEVTRGGNNIFYSYYSGEVVIPSEVTYNGKQYSVTSVGDHAFFLSSDLTSVTIGNSVTSIGSYAFNGCSGLTSLTIPSSVTSIGFCAFDGCSGLTKIISKAITPPACGDYVFDNVDKTICELYVPQSSVTSYKEAYSWKDFKNINALESSSIDTALADGDVTVTVENGNIVIAGVEDSMVEVYSLNGQCVYSGTATSIPVTAKGMYIVRVNGKAQKVIVK